MASDAPSSKVSSLVDSIFREFLEKKQEIMDMNMKNDSEEISQDVNNDDRKRQSHKQKKHKKHRYEDRDDRDLIRNERNSDSREESVHGEMDSHSSTDRKKDKKHKRHKHKEKDHKNKHKRRDRDSDESTQASTGGNRRDRDSDESTQASTVGEDLNSEQSSKCDLIDSKMNAALAFSDLPTDGKSNLSNIESHSRDSINDVEDSKLVIDTGDTVAHGNTSDSVKSAELSENIDTSMDKTVISERTNNDGSGVKKDRKVRKTSNEIEPKLESRQGNVLEHIYKEYMDEIIDNDSSGPSSPVAESCSAWMTLPKELEKSIDVNTTAWMRLPKDATMGNDGGYDSDKDFTEVLEQDTDSQVSAKKKKPARWGPIPKMNFDVSKIVSQPSNVVQNVISSIKETLIGDMHKMDNLPSANKNTESEVEIGNSEEMTEKVEKNSETTGKPTAGKIHLGLKISKTSADLIASGTKVETDPKKLNREDGEVTNSSVESRSNSEDDKSDSSSDIHISELSSNGSISDSEPEKSSGSKHRQKKSSKKKKKTSSKSRKHKSRSRSRTPQKHKRTRSPSDSHLRKNKRVRTFDEEKGVWLSRSRSRSRSRHRRSRSRDRSKHSRDRDYKRRSRSRDRHYGKRSRHHIRNRSRSPPRTGHDLRVKIDKAKLRQIAFQNAYATIQRGQVTGLGLQPDEMAAIKAGGKSVQELTEFCKKIAERQSNISSDSDCSGHDPGSEDEAPFINHPFKVKDMPSIIMNIRNAKQLPILTPAEKQMQGAELRLQFPVSSGSHHRAKEVEWVPVVPTTVAAITTLATLASTNTMKENPAVTNSAGTSNTPAADTPAVTAAGPAASVPPVDRVFPEMPTGPINVGKVVSERLSALRKLNENPNDVQAIGAMFKAQEAMNQWANSKQLPGHFTGSTGANILSQNELAGSRQAWARKDQLRNLNPVAGGIGKLLLQKMGWKEGTGLGKESAGNVEPLMLEVKIDRKGLASTGDKVPEGMRTNIPASKDLSAKHPVSGLVELCNKRRWGAPNFEIVHESGPDHKKNFLFKVIVNGMEYQSTVASASKKQAKAQAATVCLQQLGLIPR